MKRVFRPLLWMLCAGLPVSAAAQDLVEEDVDAADPHSISDQFMVPKPVNRFHLTTRITPSTAEGTFENDLRYTFVLQAHIATGKVVSLNFALPMGVFSPSPGPNPFIFGNLRLGMTAGTATYLGEGGGETPPPKLAFGGAFDVYVPTANATDDEFCAFLNQLGGGGVCNVPGIVRDMHGSEPELFIDDAFFMKLRGHADVQVGPFMGQLELGLSPGFDLVDDVDFLMLLSWGVRVSARPIKAVEPYIEAGSSIELVGLDTAGLLGANDFSTPVLLTLGSRLHFGSFKPAAFVSIDMADTYIIFGIDLGGVIGSRSIDDRTFEDPLDRM